MRNSAQSVPGAENAPLPKATSWERFPSAKAGIERWAGFLLSVSHADVHFVSSWLVREEKMEWVGSAERGKLKGKNYPLLLGDLSCWFERRQSSKGCCGHSCCLLCPVFSAAVSAVEHQDHCGNLLLPEITAWELPHGSLGCILHKLWLQWAFRVSSSGCYCCVKAPGAGHVAQKKAML